MMAPFGQAEAAREVLRCDHCKLVQFRTATPNCRRCKKSLEVEKPTPVAAVLTMVAAAPAVEQGPQVATAVRDLRHVRNLSQRQLAARMGVPRTYISKIENGKAMPTLNSLDRLARALEVEISAPAARRADAPLQRDCDADERSVPGGDRSVYVPVGLSAAQHLFEPCA